MTQLGALSDDRIELNPDVPFPPFPVWLRVPSSWSQLDSNPSTWQRSAGTLIDTTFRGSRLAAGERRDILGFFEGLVADCQRAGAALSLIAVGRRSSGGAASLGLHLAFASDGRPASLGRVHDMLPRSGLRTEIPTRSGPALLHRDRMTMVVPGTAEVVALTSMQVFVPIPGTSWTVVLATASAHAELTEPLEALLRSAAESIHTGHRPPDDEPTNSPDPDSSVTEFTAAQTVAGLGFERGFGTMVLRRIDPPDEPAGQSTG